MVKKLLKRAVKFFKKNWHILNGVEKLIPDLKVYRGACAPDISWFKVALRNVKYNGLNGDMLKECIMIAEKNYW